jgi:hypothetical protein
VPAEPEPRARAFAIGDFEVRPGLSQLTEIYVTEGCPGDELKAKRQVSGFELPGFPDIRRLEINQQLAQVEAWLAVLGTVVSSMRTLVSSLLAMACRKRSNSRRCA